MSTREQRPDRQINALAPLCDELHVETYSAACQHRPVFDAVLQGLAAGDTLVVWDFDRAFRSTIEALTTVENLRQRGIGFQAVTLGFDVASDDGKLFYTIIAAFAEHERRRLSRRTKEGLAAARLKGKRLGRRPKLTRRQAVSARQQIVAGTASLAELAARYDVHPYTVTRHIQALDRSPDI